MKVLKSAALSAALIVAGTGCAHTGTGEPGNTDTGKDHRTRNTLIAVGAAIVLGAIVANQAENNARDIVRDVVTN